MNKIMNKITHRTLILSLLLIVSACEQKNIQSEETKEVKNGAAAIKACTKEVKLCPDGSTVGRNPNNNCELDPCIKPREKTKYPIMCPTDIKECPDGSFVSRNHQNNCKFKDCPNSEK